MFNDFNRHCERLADIFFNGRPASAFDAPPRQTVTIEELVRRRKCVVRVGKKLYRVAVTEMEITEKV